MSDGDHKMRRAGSLSDAKRMLLEQRLRGARSNSDTDRLPRRPDGADIPATPYQEALWVHRQLIGDPAAYNIHLGLRIRGSLDPDALTRAFEAMNRRYESLTSILEQRADGLFLKTGATAPILTQRRLLDAADTTTAVGLLERTAIDFIREPFDLKQGPLFRACLFRVADDDYLVMLVAHHVVSDEHSLGLLLRDWLGAYARLAVGQAVDGVKPERDYGDYAYNVGPRLATVCDRQIAFWRDILADLPERLDLPTDRPRATRATYRGALVSHEIGDGLIAALDDLAGRGSLFPVLLAALNVFLARYTGQRDIAVGSPVSLRTEESVADMIGLFVNPLVLRNQVPATGSVRAYLTDVRDRVIAALTNADLPFEKLVAELAPRRDPGHNPFFQVMFVLETNPGLPTVSGLELTPMRLDTGGSKFDLSIFARVENAGLVLTAEFNTDLFDSETVTSMLTAYGTVLQRIAAQPDGALEDVALLPTVGVSRQDPLLHGPDVGYTRDRCLPERMFEMAAAHPTEPAVICGDRRINYEELTWQAEDLALVLQQKGAGPDRPVPVLMEQGIDYLVSILGILRAGAAYVPVDPDWPDDRLRCVLEDVRTCDRATTPLVVTGDDAWKRAVDLGAHAIRLSDRPGPQDVLAPISTKSSDLAYVIYTSGSTGRPKGVAVEHGNLLHSQIARLAFYADPPGRFLLVSPLIFDSSIAGLFWTLGTGGTLVLPDPADRADPRRLAGIIASQSVTHTLLLPSIYELLLQVADPAWLRSLRTVIVAGESCPAGLIDAHRRRLPGVELVNEYGPTEATVWSTAWRSADATESVPIGTPVANTLACVVDDCLHPLPVGAAGELLIGGGGVARGYFNDAALTDRHFVTPAALSAGRFYRTGDRVRQRQDGLLEYLGRTDDQIKVRGYRIEPAAIETLLRTCSGVSDAAVLSQTSSDRDTAVLVAFCVTDSSGSDEPDIEAIRLRLQDTLPGYMVPGRFEWVSELPRTATGKVDRRALAARSAGLAETRRSTEQRMTATEEAVADIWRRLLRTDRIEPGSNFFDLGGHSLLGVRLLLEIERQFECSLPLAALFETSTLAGLAGRLSSLEPGVQFQYVSAVQGGGRLTPLFCIHGAIRRLLPYLEAERPVYLVYRQFDSDTFAGLTVEALAAAYLDEIRRVQASGPYHLCGFSFGGQVAYEIARMLREEGEGVGLLGLLDPPPVGSSPYGHVMVARKLAQIRSVEGVGSRLGFLARELPAGVGRVIRRRWMHALARYRERRGAPMATALLQERDRRSYIKVSQKYRYRSFPGNALLVMPERVEEIQGATAAAFDELIQGELGVHIMRGARAHEDMMREPYCETLSEILTAAMSDAETGSWFRDARYAADPRPTTTGPLPG